MRQILFLLCFLCSIVWCTSKVVNLSGRLSCKCEKKAEARCMRAKVTLMEDDGGPSFDDEMAAISVAIGQSFKISASQFEFFQIEPYLLIDHACPDGVPKVKRIDLDPVDDVSFFSKTVDLQRQY